MTVNLFRKSHSFHSNLISDTPDFGLQRNSATGFGSSEADTRMYMTTRVGTLSVTASII